jgi:hypothetical protein
MASQVVGTAYVRLRLLTDSIGKDIEKSVKSSDLQDIDIKVNADTLKADAELKETGEEADRLGRKSPTITPKVDTKQAKKETSLLRDAIVLLGPTVGPLGAVAAGAFGLFAASAGVAVLAVKGVQKEMKTGTAVGVQFSAGIQTLKSDLSTLEATAARGVLPGFQSTITSLNSAMPGVNHSVRDLSAILGDISSRVVVGLVSGLQTFEPLLRHIAIEADDAAGHFQKWATGPGGAGFASSLGSQFDQVVPVLAHLTEAVAKLVVAFLPIGDHVVGIIGALADAINAIPLPVLTALANIFVTLYTANRLITLFRNLSISMVGFAASAGTTSVALGTLAISTAEFTAAMGPLAAILVGGYAATNAFGGVLDKLANKFATGKIAASQNSDQLTTLGNIYSDVTGQVNASSATLLKFALSGQVAGNKYDAFSTQIAGLIPHLKGLGLTTDDVETAVSGSDVAFDKWIATVEQHGGATKDDIKALEGLHDAFQYTSDSIGLSQNALKKLTADPAWGKLATSSATVDQVAAKFNISSSAVTQYASLLGISSDAIKNGVITNEQLAASVKTVSDAYTTATGSGATFLDALQKFSTSAGTAADRAQLIGSYLKASQGDLLGYSGAVASAYQANDALTNSFKQQRDQVKANTLAIGDTERAAINLKTGLIDTSRAGAGPLIQQLQAMQDAAMNAAAATYQHERATKGAGIAAIDAANIFKNQTYNALVKDASQLGLTADQAKRLADSYFAVPSDVKTKVAAIGTDPVVAVLNQIGKQLAYLTGHPWVTKTDAATGSAQSKIATLQAKINAIRQNRVPNVDANSNAAKAQIAALQAQIDALHDKDVTIRVNQVNKIIPVGAGANSPGGGYYGSTGGAVTYSGIQRMASGGPSGQVKGPGSGTSDTAGLFALSNGEFVVNAASTKIFLPELKTINSITSRSQAAQKKAAQASASMRQLTVSPKSSVGLLHMVSGPTRKPQPVGHTATLEGYMAALVASVSHLAVAYQDRPVQLVAKDGTGLAQIVNDANLKNARRAG